MKKFALGFALISAVMTAHAAEVVAVPAGPAAIKKDVSLNKFEVGLLTYRERYEEFDSAGAKLMQEEAPMSGIRLGVTRTLDENSSVGLALEYAQGKADYTGSYWGQPYGSLTRAGLDRNMVDLRAQYKTTAPMWNGVQAIVGLGYRQLTDHLEQAGPGGYKRENNRIYADIGVERTFALNETWSLTPRAQYKHILKGEQYSDLFGGTTHEQKGSGSEFALDVTYRAGENTAVITPYIRNWKVDASNVVNNTYEPKNDTRELGIKVAFLF